MRSTFAVSSIDKSREVRDEQFLNIAVMSVAFEVSSGDRSREASDEQPENM